MFKTIVALVLIAGSVFTCDSIIDKANESMDNQYIRQEEVIVEKEDPKEIIYEQYNDTILVREEKYIEVLEQTIIKEVETEITVFSHTRDYTIITDTNGVTYQEIRPASEEMYDANPNYKF